MIISGAKTTSGVPGAASALYVTAAGWVIGAFALGAGIWQDTDPLEGTSSGNAPALTIVVLCLLGAVVSFAAGAVLQRMASWQAAEVEVQ